MVTASSRRWDGSAPAVSVVVSTFRRPHLLAGLLDALTGLEPIEGGHEVVVVDNGGGSGVWEVLAPLAEAAEGRVLAVCLDANRGPGGGRNAGAAHARGRVLAVTDDDCLPTPGWLRGIAAAFEDPAVVVAQGRTAPDPGAIEGAGPWDHTQDIGGLTPWFETCNIAYRADTFRAVGGFDEEDEVTGRAGGGRAFGEDAWLGHRMLAASGGRAVFVGDAVVHHRVVPGGLRHRLREVRHMRGFPALVNLIGPGAARVEHGVFLNRRTMRVDLGVAGAIAAAVTRRPWPLVAGVPWARDAWNEARVRARGDRSKAVALLPQVAASDVAGLAALVEGSARHRRLVL